MVNTEWIFVFSIAGVLGRSMVVGYVDVMSFDEEGKITSMKAFWGDTNIRAL